MPYSFRVGKTRPNDYTTVRLCMCDDKLRPSLEKVESKLEPLKETLERTVAKFSSEYLKKIKPLSNQCRAQSLMPSYNYCGIIRALWPEQGKYWCGHRIQMKTQLSNDLPTMSWVCRLATVASRCQKHLPFLCVKKCVDTICGNWNHLIRIF